MDQWSFWYILEKTNQEADLAEKPSLVVATYCYIYND